MTDAEFDQRAIRKWARELQYQINISQETFQERHDAVYETSKHLSEISKAGPIQALNLCMQVEMEFPGRVEEFVERAEQSKFGVFWGLVNVIEMERLRRGSNL